MIAKVVVWESTGELAIAKMLKLLANTACVGLKTNQLFLQSCLSHPAFRQPTYTTSLIDHNLNDLLRNPYASGTLEMTNMLAIVPLLLLQQTDRAAASQPFQHVRRSFKNQNFDHIDTGFTVVQSSATKGSSQPLLYRLTSSSRAGDWTANYGVMKSPAENQSCLPEEQKGESSSRKLMDRYAVFRKQLQQPSLDSMTSFSVQLRKYRRHSNSSVDASTMEVAVNGSNIDAFVTQSEVLPLGLSSKSAYQGIKCHFPALGTRIEYHCFSPLSYFEKLRDDMNYVDATTASKTIRSPMPCKVLSVLKDGDEAKAGEAVMVIESMKMETSITSSTDGVLRLNVKKGDAVGDGEVLCWFE